MIVRRAAHYPVRRAVRRTLALALVAASTIALSACTWFAPPKEVSAEGDAIAETLRAIDGVAEVDVDVSSRDAKDHPNDWIFHFDVTARNSDGLGSVPLEIRTAVARATVYGVDVVLDVPAALGVAAVTLLSVDESAVTAAARLRTLPEVESAQVGGWPGTLVDKRPSASLSETGAAIRAVEGFGGADTLTGEDPLLSVTIGWDGAAADARHSVEIAASGPSDPVLDALALLGDDTSIDRIYATEAQGWSSLGDQAWGRPTIELSAHNPSTTIELLTSTADPAAVPGLRPHTAFGIRVDTGTEFLGYVGLPPGSPDPDDVPDPPEPDGAVDDSGEQPEAGVPAAQAEEWVPSTDPAALALLDQRTTEVIAFIENTQAIAGVSAEFATGVGPCVSTGQKSSVSASFVLPIFQIADSADAAFAAIVSDWKRSGLGYSDRALGLDIYSNPRADAAIAGATIRGTSEGISISVTSACV